MYHNELPESIDRWHISGTLTTLSPCHIGDGERLRIRERDCQQEFITEADVEYAGVMTGYDGKPVIPATSLKGTLRSWALTHISDEDLIRRVFGSPLAGGVVTFHDGRFLDMPKVENPKARSWSEARSTAISAHVAIDEKTRATKANLLFHVEFVPPGTRFEVSFSAQGATEQERNFLLYVLGNAFQTKDRPATLGGDAANGWGRVGWTAGEMEQFDSAAWARSVSPRTWRECLAPLPAATRAAWLAGGAQYGTGLPYGGLKARREIRFKLVLTFDGAMLVNDPSRAVKGGKRPISHAMIRREDGTPYLPAQSIRGAFRAQVTRIWQTLVTETPQDLNGATRSGGPKAASPATLSPITKIFGGTEWRTPLEIDDFTLDSGGTPCRQEFVAVDRFTGGAADKRKFAALHLWRPRFSGEIRVRAERLFEADKDPRHKDKSTAKAGKWIWMLLALALRDWAEGDGYLGLGRARGYGAFRASLEPSGDAAEVELLRGIVQRDSAALASKDLEKWAQELEALIGEKKEAA